MCSWLCVSCSLVAGWLLGGSVCKNVVGCSAVQCVKTTLVVRWLLVGYSVVQCVKTSLVARRFSV